MRTIWILLFFVISSNQIIMSQKYNKLSPFEKFVIIDKGTEPAFSGEYTDSDSEGTYVCKQCESPLYLSKNKFHSHCGWPSFDDEIKEQVLRIPDKDGRRTEIICANCKGHLGHVFTGEGYTTKNTRHCVNSVSLKFIPNTEKIAEKAIFAGGCFWGVEFYMQQIRGVKTVVSGYTGGKTKNPTYEEVCSEKTGHIEAVEITYDGTKVKYETLAKTFFEIHDPTQLNRQGPDVGEQYQSVIFYRNNDEKLIAEKLVKQLKDKGFDVKTKLLPTSVFYPAENYHQDYYQKKGSRPYCHKYVKRF